MENKVNHEFWPCDSHIVKAYRINVDTNMWLVNSGVVCDCDLVPRTFVTPRVGEIRDILAHQFDVPRERVYMLDYESARMPYYQGWVYLNDDGTWFTEDANPI